jgi:hypothetical protein
MAQSFVSDIVEMVIKAKADRLKNLSRALTSTPKKTRSNVSFASPPETGTEFDAQAHARDGAFASTPVATEAVAGPSQTLTPATRRVRDWLAQARLSTSGQTKQQLAEWLKDDPNLEDWLEDLDPSQVETTNAETDTSYAQSMPTPKKSLDPVKLRDSDRILTYKEFQQQTEREGLRRSSRLAEKQKKLEYAKSHDESIPLVVTRTGRLVKAPDRYSDAFEQVRQKGLKERQALSKRPSMDLPPSATSESTRQSAAKLIKDAEEAIAKSQAAEKSKSAKPSRSKVTKADLAAAEEALRNLTEEYEKESTTHSEQLDRSQNPEQQQPDPTWFLDFD